MYPGEIILITKESYYNNFKSFINRSILYSGDGPMPSAVNVTRFQLRLTGIIYFCRVNSLSKLAFQVAHSPFQSPQATIKKYDKIYQVGWDEIRKQSFENEKKLGFWPADMKLPERIPPNQPWTDLNAEQKSYAAEYLRYVQP